MEACREELNFSDSGAFLVSVPVTAPASSTAAPHDHTGSSSGSSADHAGATTPLRAGERTNSFVSPQWPMTTPTTPTTPTSASATPQELHAMVAAGALAPSFETYLCVPPAFVCQCARSRTEAALLYEVTSVALEMDVLMENVREQLHDRRRISEWLQRCHAAAERQKAVAVMAMDTALLVLQQQAHSVTERNLLLLIARFHTCLQKLADLQFPLAQCIENNGVAADELEELGNLEAAGQRRKLLEVQIALLERLQALHNEDSTLLLASKLMSAAQLRQHQHSVVTSVCWPAASNSDESKRSTMDDVRLSSSSGSMNSAFSASSAAEEQRRRLEDADDMNRTLTDHHEFPPDDDDDQVHISTTRENGPTARVFENGGGDKRHLSQKSSQSNSTPTSQAVPAFAREREVKGDDSHPSDHALSESVY